jgi:hypothetical protein
VPTRATSLRRVNCEQLAPGLLRWAEPHPEWNPDAVAGSSADWPQMVGSALYEAPDTVAIFDPILPRDEREEFLRSLDERVAGRPVSVLTTIRWHRRDRELVAERYSANSSRAWNAVAAGVEPRPLRGAGETMYWLPGVASLIAGDRLLGDDAGGLRVCPQSWLTHVQVDRAGLAHLMLPLLDLPIELVVVSHGNPVLHDGRAALARAIEQARED